MEAFKEKFRGRDSITIYRGSGDGIREGYSWTTSLETATWFANRFGKEGSIYRGKIACDNVFDYFPNRNEEEVLVNPKDVRPI
jgi:hypothetical protein